LGGYPLHSLVSVFLNCLPILLLIGVWIFFMRQMKKGKPAVETQLACMQAQVEETRRMNATLERIATALEERRGA
jgi:ATP-dependent Zn protease